MSTVLQPTPGAIAAAVAALRDGQVVGLPTETVYGLAADASNPAAIRRIFAAKGRPADHPVIVHVSDANAFDRLAVGDLGAANLLARAFWPGPLTMIVRRSTLVDDAVTGGRDTVGLRAPRHPVFRDVLAHFPRGLAAPSANRFGRISPTSAHDVATELGDRVDVVLDGGRCDVGVESTIVDLSGGQPAVLRPGAITEAQLADCLGRPVSWKRDGPVIAPGQLASHYAPRTPVTVIDACADLASTVSALESAGDRVASIGSSRHATILVSDDLEAFARAIYAALRRADTLGVDRIVVQAPPSEGIGVAIIDRLRRAAVGSNKT